jgi:hypothetical protein
MEDTLHAELKRARTLEAVAQNTISALRARITELEADLAASNADADALFEWANGTDNHSKRCDGYRYDDRPCSCGLLDDLRNHEKLRKVAK